MLVDHVLNELLALNWLQSFFFVDVLERSVFQAEIGEHLLEFAVLCFESLHPLDVGCLHAAIFRLLFVIRGIADAVLATNVLDGPPAFHGVQDSDNLVLSEF